MHDGSIGIANGGAVVLYCYENGFPPTGVCGAQRDLLSNHGSELLYLTDYTLLRLGNKTNNTDAGMKIAFDDDSSGSFWTKPTGSVTVRRNGSSALGSMFFTTRDTASTESEKLSIVSGNVGIGNTTPLYQLDLGATLGDKKLAVFNNGPTFYGFGIQAGRMPVTIDNVETMNLLPGTVGIGTNSPTANEAFSRLTVHANDAVSNTLAITNDGMGQNALVFNRLGGVASRFTLYQPGGNDNLRIYSSTLNSDVITFGNNGNVGIGTSSPYSLLHVGGGNIGAYSANAAGATGELGAQLYLGDNNFNNGTYYNSAPGIGAVYDANYSNAGSLGVFCYNSTANGRVQVAEFNRSGLHGRLQLIGFDGYEADLIAQYSSAQAFVIKSKGSIVFECQESGYNGVSLGATNTQQLNLRGAVVSLGATYMGDRLWLWEQTGQNYGFGLASYVMYTKAGDIIVQKATPTDNGKVETKVALGSADPTVSDLESGFSTIWKNTTSGEVRHWVNDGGTMMKSAAYT